MGQIHMANDPFRILIEACNALYPDVKAEVYFMPKVQIDEIEKDVLGLTNFPDDESTPEIFIKAEQNIEQAVDILAHELAHVAVGVDAGHEAKWKEVYEALYRKYLEIVDMESEENYE